MPEKQPQPKRRVRLIHTKIGAGNDFSEPMMLAMVVGFIVICVLVVFFFPVLLYAIVVPVLALTGFVMLFLLYGMVLEAKQPLYNKKNRFSSLVSIFQYILFLPFMLVLLFLCALMLVLGTGMTVPVIISEWVIHRYNDAVRRVYRKRAEMIPITVTSIKQWENLPFGRRFVFEGTVDESSKQFDNSTLVYQAQHEVYTIAGDSDETLEWLAFNTFSARKTLLQPMYVLFDSYPIMVHHAYGRHPDIDIRTQEITKIDNNGGELYKGMRRIVGVGVGARVRVHGKVQLNERRQRNTQPYMIEKIELLSPLVQMTRPPTAKEAERDIQSANSRLGGSTFKEAINVDTLTDFSVFNYEPAKHSRFGGTSSGQSRKNRFGQPQSQTNKRRANSIISALTGQTPSPKKGRFGNTTNTSRFGGTPSTSRFGSGQSRFGSSSGESRFGNSNSRFSSASIENQPPVDIPYDDLITSTPDNPLPFDDDNQ
ncbi:MAG: hypothetical protein AAFR81_21675 [Chloroflexota bacterium]